MSKTITGIPDSISRPDYARLIESVGFDPHHILELRFGAAGIYVTIPVYDADGGFIYDDGYGGGMVKSEVFIPVRDEEGK